jgi:hypothetical protein
MCHGMRSVNRDARLLEVGEQGCATPGGRIVGGRGPLSHRFSSSFTGGGQRRASKRCDAGVEFGR